MTRFNNVSWWLVCSVILVGGISAMAAAAVQPFNPADRAAALAATPASEVPYLVYLDSRVFVPRGRAELVNADREKVFVQFSRTLDSEARAALESKGFVIYETFEPFTYLAAVPQSAGAALKQQPLFRGLEPIEASDKVTANLFLWTIPEHAVRPGGQAASFFRFYDDVSLASALSVLDGAGVTVSDRGAFLFGSRIAATATRDQVLAACQSPLVRAAFEIPPPFVINNAQSAGFSNVPAVQIAPYGLTGSGVAVGIWDGGQVRSTHQDLTSRITVREVAQPISNHSTHVAGTILGSGTGNAAAKGMAPAATGFSYDFNGDVATEQANSVKLTTDAIALSNNSFGFVIGWRLDTGTCQWTDGSETNFGSYDGSSQTWDALIKKNKLVVVKSAGNEGSDCGPVRTCTGCPSGPISCPAANTDCDGTLGSDGVRYDTIDSGGSSKNVLTVGSVGDALGRAYYSSAGPADDGRFKPEVVTDGGDQSIDNGVTSTCSASDSNYCALQGTSMAAPVVSGIVALIDQAWKNLHASRSPSLNKPTPELVKALLINNATDLGRPGPDYIYGFGLVKAKEAIDALQAPNTAGQSTLASNQVRIGFVSEGELLNYQLVTPVGVPTGPMKTTVAWTDEEGTSAAIVRYCNYADFKTVCTSDANCPVGGTCLPAPCGAVPCHLKNDIETLLWNTAATGVIGFPWVPPGVASLTANAGAFINHVDPVEQIVAGSNPTGGNFPLHVFGFTVASGQQRVAVVSNKQLKFFPANDNFANAKTLPGLLAPDPMATGCVSGDVPCPATLYQHNTWDSVNYDATLEAGEPTARTNVKFSIWFKWVAPANGQVVFDTAGADFDTVLAVYTGASLGTLSLVTFSDDAMSSTQSRVSFDAASGSTYYLQVTGYYPSPPIPEVGMGVFPLNYYVRGTCGNGITEIDEACDDGNVSAGDCCSATCGFEAGGGACHAPGNVCALGSCNTTGTCVAGAPLVCNDGNGCTNDACNPVTGCVFTNNNAACDDGNACTTSDTCSGGACLGGPPPALPNALLTLAMPSHTGLTWTTLPGAAGYDAVRGDLLVLRSSGGNFTTSTTSCLADDQLATSLTDAPSPAPGGSFFYLVRGSNCSGSGTYDTGSAKQIGSRDAEVDAAPIACATLCSRSKCLTGPAFDPGCGGCIATVCAADSFCCDTVGGAWDGACVDEVYTVCSSVQCATGACTHSLCTPGGGPLTAGCDNPPVNPSCVAAICAADLFCCTTDWDQSCYNEVASVCGKNCN